MIKPSYPRFHPSLPNKSCTVLRMTFDGEQAVWCPVGDFFCAGIEIHAHKEWDQTVEADGRCKAIG